MAANRTILDTLLELQQLDRVPRSGYALRGIADPESVAEHTFQLVFMVWSLAPEVPELDRGRLLELALVHDLAETRIGDLPRTAAHYFPDGAKRQAESLALQELLAPLGSRGPDLFAEYQAGVTAEARFVSACDKVQLMIKATVYEEAGSSTMGELLAKLDDFSDGGFQAIRKLVQALQARRQG